MHNLTFKNGDTIPQLGLGTWKSAPGEVYKAIRSAIEIGYRHIDCAFTYGNEAEIGEAFRDAIAAGDVTRKDLFVTSKLWNTEHHEKDVLPAIQKSIDDLSVDYLDLYLIHWPVSIKKKAEFPLKGDDFISPEELPLIKTWQAMVECQQKDLTRHIGVSNFSITRLNELIRASDVMPEMNQVESHPYLNQRELIAFCRDHDILVTAYSPLGSMDRNTALKGENEPYLLENDILKDIANQHDCTAAQVILAWDILRGVAVIPKSVNEGRQKENFDAQKIHLNEEDMNRIDGITREFRYVSGSFWTGEGSPYTLEYLWD